MDTLIVKVQAEQKDFLLQLLSKFAFIEVEVPGGQNLPVIWAEKADVTALFSASQSQPINLSKIRQSWKRHQ
ncbi:MAG: hypothetical protein ACFCUI_00280 [Bernardetiaceae bacterium]